MRALITGARGFVGRHLHEHLERSGDEVVGVDSECDVTDAQQVDEVISQFGPDVVYHLAGKTHVGESFSEPALFTKVNVVGTRNVLDAVWKSSPEALTVLVSSSDVYGIIEKADLPVHELHRVNPQSPYAASKLEAEHVAHELIRERSQKVVIVRPFNHIGPGQAPSFVVPALASRLIEAAQNERSTIVVGDLSTRRDFLDVRDVVRAYRLLALLGTPGETYNVASGHDVAIADIANELRNMVAPSVEFVRDESLFRPSDIPEIRGDFSKLRNTTGWEPKVSLAQTLKDVVDSLNNER